MYAWRLLPSPSPFLRWFSSVLPQRLSLTFLSPTWFTLKRCCSACQQPPDVLSTNHTKHIHFPPDPILSSVLQHLLCFSSLSSCPLLWQSALIHQEYSPSFTRIKERLLKTRTHTDTQTSALCWSAGLCSASWPRSPPGGCRSGPPSVGRRWSPERWPAPCPAGGASSRPMRGTAGPVEEVGEGGRHSGKHKQLDKNCIRWINLIQKEWFMELYFTYPSGK